MELREQIIENYPAAVAGFPKLGSAAAAGFSCSVG
jgi:hypothetical protein